MEQRLRLDIPALADPVVRDLLQESDLFVRSFNGMGGFGLLSPFDFVHIFALLSELISHMWILISLTGGSEHIGALTVSLLSALLPLLLKWCGVNTTIPETVTSQQEARAAERQEKLRNLAYSETHRPEIIIFGLGPWILRSWASARKAMLNAEHSASLRESGVPYLLSQINVSDILFALQNVGCLLLLVVQLSQSCLDTAGHNSAIFLDFSWIFGSLQKFHSGRGLHNNKFSHYDADGFPGHLPDGSFLCRHEATTSFKTRKRKYRKIYAPATRCSITSHVCFSEASNCTLRYNLLSDRNLCYTYPGNTEPSLTNVTFSLQAGETLAIVGYNGSGTHKCNTLM